MPEAILPFKNVVVIVIITFACKYILDWYLETKAGMLLRAVGDNDKIITSLSVDKGKVKIIGLAIANGLVSLSGCIFAQEQRFFDVSMGTGTMSSVLPALSLVQVFSEGLLSFGVTTSVVIGSVIYKACVALAINLGFASTDLKFITAALFLIILVLGMERKKKVNIHA